MTDRLLSDLDELAHSVRDPASRVYISEALAAYRAGAYRASLVATWTAVATDTIAKFRELAALGNLRAQELIAQLDEAITRGQRARLQEIERGLLEVASDEFELLSAHERTELERLHEDRHLCAHPAFVSQEHLYQPSAESVRAHFVHAIRYLLSQRPVQGKHALAQLVADLGRRSFPADPEEAMAYLDAQYFGRAKESLLRNASILLLKAFLRADNPALSGQTPAVANALRAVQRRAPDLYREILRSKLDGMVAQLDDAQLNNVCRLFAIEPGHWSQLSGASQARVRQHVRASLEDATTPAVVLQAALVPALEQDILDAFRRLDRARQIELMAAEPLPGFVREGIRLYSSATSFRGAEYLAEHVIEPLVRYYTSADVAALLAAAEANPQIWNASGTPAVLERVFDTTRTIIGSTSSAWQGFVRSMRDSNGVDDYYSYPGLQSRLSDCGLGL